MRSPNEKRRISLEAILLPIACVGILGTVYVVTGIGTAPPVKPSSRPIILGPLKGVPSDESWFVHKSDGTTIGYQQVSVFQETYDEMDMVRIRSIDVLNYRRYGNKVQQKLTQESFEAPDGRVLAFGYRLESGDSSRKVQGYVEDGLLELKTPEGTRNIQLETEYFSMFAVSRSLKAKPIQSGETTRIVTQFRPLSDRFARIQLNFMPAEETTLLDRSEKLIRLEEENPNKKDDGWSRYLTHWADQTGTVLKTTDPFFGRETVAATEEVALSSNTGASIDVGIDRGVRLTDKFERPEDSRLAVYSAKLKNLPADRVFPSDTKQTVVGGADTKTALITVRTVQPRDGVEEIEPSAEMEKYLKPNKLIDCDNPHVAALASAIGANDDKWLTATTIEHYLFTTLRKNEYGQVFDEASKVAQKESGDCSEHAVLLAALCRKHNIPARVVVGLVYSKEDRSFLYHMWNEVWIRGTWIALDATIGKGVVGADHIKFRDSSLAGQTAYDLLTPITSIVGQIEIKLQGVEY